MHFFYLDESGDTGANLEDPQQPIFVLGGLSVADKKWNNTKERLDQIIRAYFDGEVPAGFEVHSNELLSPNGEGPFAGHPINERLQLVKDLLGLMGELGHHVHYFAIETIKGTVLFMRHVNVINRFQIFFLKREPSRMALS